MATATDSIPAPARRLLRAAGPCRVLSTADILTLVASDTPEVGSADLDALLPNRPGNSGFVAIQPEMFRSVDETGNSDLVVAHCLNYPVLNGVVAAPSCTADAVLDAIRREVSRQGAAARIERRRRFSSAVRSRVTQRRSPSPAPVRIRS